MKTNISEVIYDISETIYKNMCRYNYDKNYNDIELIETINNCVDNHFDSMTTYDFNKIMLEYGIDNAVNKYSVNKDLNKISSDNFSKNIVKNLVMMSYEITI
tara:strand:+ start:1230 stop:1535 length:306 start_codon:yes stop_codon:yes gene_type:complete